MESVDFEIDGRAFHALTWGEPGRPMILFLHGFPEFSGAWEKVAPRLADRWFCVAPDQRGYGRSWRPEGVERYVMRELVGDALAVLERFGNGRAAAVVGHDWGASVAYALAFRAPERIGRLVVVNGVHPIAFQDALAEGGAQAERSAYIPWLRRDGSEAPLAADGYARLWRMFGDLPARLTPERRRAYEEAWGGTEGLRSMVDWYRASPMIVPAPGERVPPEALPRRDPERFRVRMPHLVIWGLEDAAFAPELRRGAKPYARAFELEEVEGADHWVIHLAPERVAERIARFLGEPAP